MTNVHFHTFNTTGKCECGFIAPGSTAAAAQARAKANRDNTASYRKQQKLSGKVYLQRWVTPDQRDDIDAYLSGTK